MMEYKNGLYEHEQNISKRNEENEVVQEDNSLIATKRPKFMKWSVAELSHVYLRRYRLRDSAMELFFIAGGGSGSFLCSISAFFDFGPGYARNCRRDDAANSIMKRAPLQCIKQWP